MPLLRPRLPLVLLSPAARPRFPDGHATVPATRYPAHRGFFRDEWRRASSPSS